MTVLDCAFLSLLVLTVLAASPDWWRALRLAARRTWRRVSR
jgi:hypothetical protein